MQGTAQALPGRCSKVVTRKINPDEELATFDWRDAGHPYKLDAPLQPRGRQVRVRVGCVKLSAWVKETGQRVVILSREGRDAAGKRQCRMKRYGHLNPRSARVVAW
ncbi:MAG: hypothetical protein IPI16_22245 [Comamonadaceae bacterium]|nr:hypothetical protein [Comamonadaceae bacterium]